MTLQYARSFDANQNRIQIIEQIIEPHLFAGAGDSFGIDGLEEVALFFVPRPELFSISVVHVQALSEAIGGDTGEVTKEQPEDLF